jgi:adenylate cyclase
MGMEIERKFLVKTMNWKKYSTQTIPIRQAYLCSDPERTVRVRLWGTEGKITIKSKAENASRLEFEYDIPSSEALEMLEALCLFPQIQKTRFLVPNGKHVWEVDVFEGHNEGLIIAEIELEAEDESFELPDWVGEDVTEDHRYSNSFLARNSFRAFYNE